MKLTTPNLLKDQIERIKNKKNYENTNHIYNHFSDCINLDYYYSKD